MPYTLLIGSILFLLALASGAIGVILHFLKTFKQKIEFIEKTPLTGVGRLQAGHYKATGTSVADGESLVSPLSQTKCLFYHFKVEELQSGNTGARFRGPKGIKGGTQTSTWVTVVNDKQAAPCALQDETGTALVDLLGAEMVLKTNKPLQTSIFKNASPEVQENLKRRYDFSTKGLLLNKSLRYTEMVIRPGDKLFVMGDVRARNGEPPAFVKGEHALIVSDQDEAGVLTSFRRRITGCYVGMTIVGVVACIFMAAPIYILATFNPGPVPKQGALAVERRPGPKHAPAAVKRQRQAPPVRLVAQPIRQDVAAAVNLPEPSPEPGTSAPDPGFNASTPPNVPAPSALPGPPTPLAAGPKKAVLTFVNGLVVDTQVCLVNAANGRLLEANRQKNNGSGSVAILRTEEGFESPHRQWIVNGVADAQNAYTLVNVECDRLLDGERASVKRDGAKVQLFETRAARDKERNWRFYSAGDGLFYIVNVASGRYLEADPATLEKNATKVRLRATRAENRPEQKWRIGRVQ